MCHILKKLKEIDIILVENALLANEYTYHDIFLIPSYFKTYFLSFFILIFSLVVITTTPLPVDY